MKKQRNIARLSTTLVLASLMSSVALIPIRQARAQTVGGSWAFTGSLNTARYGHTATLLNTGKLLVAAGDHESAELYDPATGAWSPTGSLTSQRINHSATLLQNGQVLVVGGYDYTLIARRSPPYLNTAELYDPEAGTWRPAASLISTYTDHRATLLQNGKVLVVGVRPGSLVVSAELYDPAAGTWSSTDAPTVFGLLTLLPSGKVLLPSGQIMFTGTLDPQPRSEVYDPTTETWSSTNNPNVTRLVNTTTLLQNGKVLITGDTNASPRTLTAELYDPSTGFWSTTGSPLHYSTCSTLLSDGRVLLTGALDPNNNYLPVNESEIYDSETGAWSLTSQLNTARLGHTATLLPDGRVLVAGGDNGDFEQLSVYNSAELYAYTASPIPSPIDESQFFVRRHYGDFLNREPDANGLTYWTNEIVACGIDAGCIEAKRINVSAAFFLSIEFQETGYLIYRMYKTAYGDLSGMPVPLTRQEFLPDTHQIGQGVVVGAPGWEQALENNKNILVNQFVARSRFTTAFPPGMTAEQLVDALNANAGGPLSQPERNQLVSELVSGTKTRAQVLRSVAEDADLARNEFNKAFVLMQYFGYLRRNPNDLPDTSFSGFSFWLNKLDAFGGNFANAEMVKAFISSGEYRRRFGS